MKILIIRFSAIGDIAWTSPVIRCCKQQLPNAEIHFCTKAKFGVLVENNPYLDKVHYLNDSLVELLGELKSENFDYVIDLHSKIRSKIIAFYLGKKTYTYNKLSFQRFLFTKFQINFMAGKKHVAERYLDTVKKIGVVNDYKGLDFFIAAENELSIENFPEVYKNGYASFVIGASQPTKKLPLEKMAELCFKIKLPIMLLGGKEDFELGEQLISYLDNFISQIEKKPQLLNVCGKYNLGQSASIVKQSDLVYGHDTGLTHVAAAFGKKIYSIWGPTSPISFAPYMADNVLIENNNLTCRPCSKSGLKQCPKGHFKCLKEVEFNF